MSDKLADRIDAMAALWVDSPHEDVRAEVAAKLRGPSEREVMQAICCGKYGGCLRPNGCECDSYEALNKYGYKATAHAVMKLYAEVKP